jgi:hypothetical protein
MKWTQHGLFSARSLELLETADRVQNVPALVETSVDVRRTDFGHASSADTVDKGGRSAGPWWWPPLWRTWGPARLVWWGTDFAANNDFSMPGTAI